MKIENLSAHPEQIPNVGRWAFDSWSHFYPGKTLEETIADFRVAGQEERLPVFLVALSDGLAIGTASLVANDDLPNFDSLTPWLASVYVDPKWRKAGIGLALVKEILDRARWLQYEEVYLWTEDKEEYYRKRGWRLLDTAYFHGVKVSVMSMRVDGSGND